MGKPQVLSSVTSMKKKTKGRIKIKMKKIEETNNLQVAFSKRRAGIFKKACELYILTGSQIDIVVTSPGGHLYAFGDPNADVVIDEYAITTKNYSQPAPPLEEFSKRYVEVSKELEAEKKRIPVSSAGSRWFEEHVDGPDVEEYIYSLEEFKKKIQSRADELMIIDESCAFFDSNAYGIINGVRQEQYHSVLAGGLNEVVNVARKFSGLN